MYDLFPWAEFDHEQQQPQDGRVNESTSAAPTDLSLLQPTVGQKSPNFGLVNIDGYDEHEHHNSLFAKRSGKQQQVQQRDVGIKGKIKAIELEEEKEPEFWIEGRGQQGQDLATTAVIASNVESPFIDRMGVQYPYITKRKKGDKYVHCIACNSDINVTLGKNAVIQHIFTKKHIDAVKMMESVQIPGTKRQIAGGELSGTTGQKIFQGRSGRYLDSMDTQFEHITKSEQGDSYAHCTTCNSDISLRRRGTSAIRKHQKTEKHKRSIMRFGSTVHREGTEK
jgi:RNA polymerase-binding transcription factor DksA